MIFGGFVWHYFLLMVVAVVFVVVLEAFTGEPTWIESTVERAVLNPNELIDSLGQLSLAGRQVPVASVVATALVYSAGVAAYYLIGRWVFNRAVGRFAKSRDATA